MDPRLADWMTPVDRDILELLENDPGKKELALTPRLISENTDWGADTVREHLLELRDHGLVEYRDEPAGIYQLSERGRNYLAGELDVGELEEK